MLERERVESESFLCKEHLQAHRYHTGFYMKRLRTGFTAPQTETPQVIMGAGIQLFSQVFTPS